MSNLDFMLAQEDIKKWHSPEDDMEENEMENKELKELKDKIESIEISYDFEDTYNKLYNACIDYMNETQNFFLDDLFSEYINYDSAESIAKQELENGGLERLKCFLGDTNLYYRDIFRIDNYGNLCNVDKDDLEYLKDDIIDLINYELEKNI